MNKNQRELKAVDAELSKVALEAKSIGDNAKKEDRELTEDENSQVEALITKSETLKGKKAEIQSNIAVEDKITELGRDIASEQDETEAKAAQVESKSIGEQFVESKAYRLAATTQRLHAVDPVEVKTTLTEAGGGAGLIVPQYEQGVLPKLFQRLTVADLIASGTTTSPTITYMRETEADGSAVTTVAEGGEKPEAKLAYDQVSVTVKKIAGFLPVTDEMLEDAAQLSSYINGRLSLFVKIAEEYQLLNGDNSGSHLNGILHQIPSENKAIENEDVEMPNAADHIFAAITKIRSKFIEPDGIVMNPDDWATLRLVKDKNGNYIAGTPFSNTGSNPGDSLFSKPVVVTQAVAAGSPLVGAFQSQAQVFRRSGLTVETSNSHAEFFRENLVGVRAEERLALAVYRPEAFATAVTVSAS
jgi:HK97 family phage major capsid protein